MLLDTFPTALAWLLRPDVEGGEANHPADRGGHTKYGIADAADGVKDGMADLDRDGQPDVAISALTPAQTNPFYHQHYWLPAGCDRVETICPLIAIALFDGAVHHGPGRSVRLLQQALGIMADGVPGSQTLRVLSAKTRHDGGRTLPEKKGDAVLSAEDKYAADQLGISHDEFVKAKQG